MFAKFKQIFNPKNKDLLKRILFTLAALFVFKIGTSIIVPGVKVSTSGMSFLEVINAMSGGAFTRASIFALGVTPYITAQIVIQLLSADIVPYLSELTKQGGVGRRKLDQITRIVGICLAFLQGYMYSYAYIGNGSPMDYMLYSLILTAGTAFVMWIGDEITQKGIGNGMSLIIMAGIISVLPGMFKNLWVELMAKGFLGIVIFLAFVLVFVGIIIGVIYVELAERRIPIQYANKSTSMLGKQNYIPFKLNSAGVMPVIFASALLSIPQILSSVIKKEGFTLFVQKYLTYTTGVGLILYVVLILAFAYFYTFMQLKPSELSDNLNKNGGYIPGIHPGKETILYVKNVLKRITIVGAVFLATLAILPILFDKVSNLTTSITISGTGLLIVVGVALDTYKQIESQLVSRSYVKGRKGRK
ncbi:MAG: preprotein translocase subunit SecY [Methanobacteriaceae archaeon]|nr:preprotein translocase subunit SecY [Methanobacteriaceae archaeon]